VKVDDIRELDVGHAGDLDVVVKGLEPVAANPEDADGVADAAVTVGRQDVPAVAGAVPELGRSPEEDGVRCQEREHDAEGAEDSTSDLKPASGRVDVDRQCQRAHDVDRAEVGQADDGRYGTQPPEGDHPEPVHLGDVLALDGCRLIHDPGRPDGTVAQAAQDDVDEQPSSDLVCQRRVNRHFLLPCGNLFRGSGCSWE